MVGQLFVLSTMTYISNGDHHCIPNGSPTPPPSVDLPSILSEAHPWAPSTSTFYQKLTTCIITNIMMILEASTSLNFQSFSHFTYKDYTAWNLYQMLSASAMFATRSPYWRAPSVLVLRKWLNSIPNIIASSCLFNHFSSLCFEQK